MTGVPHSCEAFSFQELADHILFSQEPKLTLSSLLVTPDDAEGLIREKDLTRSDSYLILILIEMFLILIDY